MNEIEYHKSKVTEFQHLLNKRYGGLFTYLKLYKMIWNQIFTVPLGFRNKLICILSVLLKTPWWLLIKPFGCLFSKTVKSKGMVKITGDEIVYFDGTKEVLLKLIGIPIAYWTSTKFPIAEQMERAGLEP